MKSFKLNSLTHCEEMTKKGTQCKNSIKCVPHNRHRHTPLTVATLESYNDAIRAQIAECVANNEPYTVSE
jgi:hypothetical protein